MALATGTEPWTAAVPWARPWARPGHRPAPGRPSAAGSRAVRASAVSDAVQESAWTEAVAELQAAREVLVGIEPELDAWHEALARHDVYRARRRLRRLQESLTGADADVPWSNR